MSENLGIEPLTRESNIGDRARRPSALGRTPPPWRWRADMMATAIATHVAYVVAVAAVDDVLGR